MRTHAVLSLTLALGLNAQIPEPREATVRAHLAFLSDDLLEGRGTGERGGDLAVLYLASQLQALGLQGANGGSYFQPVRLRGMLTLPSTELHLQGAKESQSLKLGREIAVGASVPELDLDAPLVFVGHGIDAEGRDDFKGIDLRGKIMVCFSGPVPESEGTCCNAIHYAARWRGKALQAGRRGAAGVLVIHSDASAGYAWSVAAGNYGRERFELEAEGNGLLGGWISEALAARILQAAGKDLGTLRKEAEGRAFKPFALPFRLRGRVQSRLRQVVQRNVVGLLPGTDPVLKGEALVYSAHWDHLGRDPRTGSVYNGAVDNGSACAALLALAQEAVPRPARRSQIFLFTCAEEAGLLGAEAFVKSGLWPRHQLVADLNLESLNVWGPTRDVGLMGSENSTLHAASLRVLQGLGMTAAPARPDPAALYFRADHFPFAQAGIPAFSPGFSLNGGWDFVDPEQAARARAYGEKQYHQPTDRYDPAWDLRGLLQQTRFILGLGLELANGDERPSWTGPRPEFGR